jgi:hypothetical protein
MNKCILTAFILLTIVKGFCQDGPNLGDGTPMASNAGAASKFMSDQVNLFTGQPDISVPVFSYRSNNGIGMSIGLHYTGTGGLRLNEQASSVGLGWYLSYGGSVTRVVRGLPDDIPLKGFLYTAAIPADYRTNGNKYHFDTLDSQQDVFQFSFNGNSGKFFIRKNKEVILVPYSKLKVQPNFDPDPNIGKLLSFTITTEDGVRYLFKDGETTTHSSTGMHQGYTSIYTSWNLSDIISPFGADTIHYTYTNKSNTGTYGYPLVYLMPPPYTSIYKVYNFSGSQSFAEKKIKSISLPNKQTVNFIYSPKYNYINSDSALQKITISDSIFRSGFFLDYTDTAEHLFLKSVIPYTAKERRKGYEFYYEMDTYQSTNFLRDVGIVSTNVDDWGFNLGRTTNLKTNFINTDYPSGVWDNRIPSLAPTKKFVLSRMALPEGGNILYDYELNDKGATVLTYNYFSVAANATSNNNIAINNAYSDGHVITFKIDSSLLRTQSPPLTGTCNFSCKIKASLSATSALDSVTVSLYDLYYNGLKRWTTNITNGNYVLETKFSGTGSVTTAFNIYVSWYNHTSGGETVPVGGLRIKQIRYKNDYADTGSVSTKTYRYVLETGESSGSVGESPMSAYDYRETYVNNSTFAVRARNFYKAVSQQPMNAMDFSQGSSIGYSRVEVINGTLTNNIGKEVHEFTGLREAGNKTVVSTFPYSPNDLNNWAIGLPSCVKVYDNAGLLLKKTNFQYDIRTTSYISSDDRSLKLGLAQIINFESAPFTTVSKKNVYLADEYYPQSGRVFQTFVYDTTYNTNGSTLTSKTEMQYDTSLFLVKKIITSYDRNRGLNLEKRFYYPQDYTIGGVIGKLRDSGIITSVIATELWITGDPTPRILSGSITDLQQLTNGGIRPYRSYALESNKPIPGTTIGNFNPALLNRNTNYFKQQTEYPVYDAKGNLVQTTSTVTGLSASVITDYGNLYKTAEVSNAIYADIAYTSFESDGNGNWTVNSTTRTNASAYSGKLAYTLANGTIVKSGLTASKTYLITVWAKSGATININGVSIGTAVTNYNGWYLYSKSITGVTNVTISGTGTIDELRIHPAEANMITYTYEPNIGITSTVDANNTVIYNEYDNLNRLKVVRDRNKNVVQKYEYTDSIYPVSLLPTWAFYPGPSGIVCGQQAFQYQERQKDTNPYSNSYGGIQYVTPSNLDSCLCPPVNYKCINGVVEQGVRKNKSTTRLNNTPPYQWQCVYYYTWSDCSVSPDFIEINSTACTTSSGCGGGQQ